MTLRCLERTVDGIEESGFLVCLRPSHYASYMRADLNRPGF